MTVICLTLSIEVMWQLFKPYKSTVDYECEWITISLFFSLSLSRRVPQRKTKEKYALGITLFPALKDPLSAKGYVSCVFILKGKFTQK